MIDVNAHFEDLIAAIDRGESLPVSWYTDPDFTNLELQKIFRKTWQYVGPLSDLQKTGDFISGFCGDVPVAAVRNETGLTGFVNVCRHRRHQVMKGRGNVKMLQCGYHAWTYDLTGCLKGAPRSQMEPDFNLNDYPLLPARAEALGPWVFVNLDLNARPLSYYFGDVLGLLAQSGLDLNSLQLWERDEWEARANWKTMLENFLECYHCAVAHPSFSAAIDVRPENYALTTYDWVLSQVGNVRQSALEGKSAVKIYDVHGSLDHAQYHLLWPNFTLSINPGVPNLSIDVWLPYGPNRAKGFSEHYFGPGVTRQQAEEMIAFNAEVGAEDDELTNSVQLGLISGLPPKGRFLTRSEHLAVDFLKMVAAAMTGQHDDVGAQGERNAYDELEIVRIEPESDEITSFYLRRVDGAALVPWSAGQFLPIRLEIPGHDKPIVRTYTISTVPNADHYRLSIKRMGGNAVCSNHFHDNLVVGSRVEALAPRGKFVLDSSSDRPAVLLSGGVGITPMIAFADALLEKGRASGTFRPMTFVHQARNGRAAAFGKHLRAAAAEHPSMRLHVCYSDPCETDALGTTHESVGRVDADLVATLVTPSECDFYLCGPPGFMQTLYDGLIAKDVPADRIHFESFGTATVLKPQTRPATAPSTEAAQTSAIPVHFAKSGIDALWTRDAGTLLELAEASGLAPVFGCRSGICGSCTTRVASGSVDYVNEPLATCEPGEVLICSSVPRSSRNPDGEELGIVLDV
ncbi:MAG TPA: SRPBCC family protein [Candidatus Baltobacteraceae bacterium]|nr:SRPBCC family protein [Candidatus Baltobacteraceae bacterium]